MDEGLRLNLPLGLSRLDAGRAFFATFDFFILVGWYPQLQVTYVSAHRGADFVAVGLVAAAVGAVWGSGGMADALLIAAAAALGSGAGFALGGALVAELSAVRPFYASMLDRAALEAALWGEFMPAIVGSALGAFAGAIGATLTKPRSPTLGARAAGLGLIAAALAAAATVALGAATIVLVAERISTDGPASSIDPIAIRVAVLALACVSAASAVLVRRRPDRTLTVAITIPRLLAGAALVAIPYLVAAIYREFVLNPFGLVPLDRPGREHRLSVVPGQLEGLGSPIHSIVRVSRAGSRSG